jgi:hypothetical protein
VLKEEKAPCCGFGHCSVPAQPTASPMPHVLSNPKYLRVLRILGSTEGIKVLAMLNRLEPLRLFDSLADNQKHHTIPMRI